jgi:hypothetical protein
MDFRTFPTVWYFKFFILVLFYFPPTRQSVIFTIHIFKKKRIIITTEKSERSDA